MNTTEIIAKAAAELGVRFKSGNGYIDLDDTRGERLAGTYRDTPAGRIAALEDLNRLKQNQQPPTTGGKLRIELNTLLCVDPDVTMYHCQPGDKETPANISVANLKEILLAVNACSRRIRYLLEDLKRAEDRIEALEQHQTYD